MKGAVFTTFEQFIIDNHGEDTLEDILSQCNLITTEPFVPTGSYPDEDMLEIVGKTVEKLKIPLKDALFAFGEYLFVALDSGFPAFRESESTLKGFLKSVEDVIHVEVRKLYPDSYTPTFVYEEPNKDQLNIIYRSKRKLCFLMEGLLEGAAKAYGEKIDQKQTQCTHIDGSDDCSFEIKFLGKA